MVSNLCLLIAFCITSKLITAQPSPFGFRNQYIGSSENSTQQKNLCTNFWCINDAFYIFSKASQYKGVDPCVDFRNFTVNQADEVDKLDDRYIYRGFPNIVSDKYFHRLRRVLDKPDEKDDKNRIVRVLKNVFRRCRNSKHTFRHLEAHRDIMDYLQSLGGSPYVSKHLAFNPNRFDFQKDFKFGLNPGNVSDEDALWNEKEFNLEKVFKVEPWNAINFLLNFEIGRCGNGMLCLKKSSDGPLGKLIYRPGFDKFYRNILMSILETLEDKYLLSPDLKEYVEEVVFRPTVDRIFNFFIARDKLETELQSQFSDDSLTIMELNQLIPFIDWPKIFKDELLTESKVDETEIIFIENGGSKVLKGVADMLLTFDKKTMADAFVMSFIHHHRLTLILHWYSRKTQAIMGTKHGVPRWESCLEFYVNQPAHPAMLVMYEQKREKLDRNVGDFERDLSDDRVKILENARNFSWEAINFFKKTFINGNDLESSVAADVVKKLKSINVIFGMEEKIFPYNKLETFYKDLDLNGSENFLKSVMAMENFHRKILNEKSGNWRKEIEEMTNYKKSIMYTIPSKNYLYIPPRYIMYPYYHPLRSRFFNVVTLFREIIVVLNSAVNYYVRNQHNVDIEKYTLGISFIPNLIYYDYKEWLKTHEEREIGANHMTNLQLYWAAYVFQDYRKLHRAIHQNFEPRFRLEQKYLHTTIQSYEGFREAFNCSISKEFVDQYEAYADELYELLVGEKRPGRE